MLTPEERNRFNDLVDRSRRGGRSLADVLDVAGFLWTEDKAKQAKDQEILALEGELNRWHAWEIGLLGGCLRGEVPHMIQMMDGFKEWIIRRTWRGVSH